MPAKERPKPNFRKCSYGSPRGSESRGSFGVTQQARGYQTMRPRFWRGLSFVGWRRWWLPVKDTWPMTRLFLFVIAIFSVSGAALAMDFELQGHEVVMSGDVTGGECAELQSILQRTQISIVILTHSKGGDADAGYCVGALIRQHGLATVIRGSCNSSCSRMWLGGVSRSLDGAQSRVGLHGNYRNGALQPSAPARLQAWIPTYAPAVNRRLMEQWTNLPSNEQIMFFYNDRAELCDHGQCRPLPEWNAFKAGLSTP